MEYIKKNLTVILLSVISTLLLIIAILLIVNNNTFKFSNSSNKQNTEKENTKEIKKKKDKEETNLEEKEELVENKESEPVVEKKEEVKREQPVVSTEVKEEKNENNVISYFENNSVTDKLKNGFVSVIDFIFYEKEIKGYTFKELTNTAKLKIIGLALAIDNKIDSYFPGYKEKLADKYKTVKGKLALKYLEVTTSFCNKDPDTCNQAKEDFTNMKNSFGFTWDLVKELAKSGSSKIKELYENWR